jgi:hypothetical protein
MSSLTLTSAKASPTGHGRTKHKSSPNFPRGKTIALVIAAVVVCIAAWLATIFWNRIWPFTEKAVVQDLAEASDSTVTIRKSHRTYFPFPGCVLEGIEFHHGPNQWTLITIDKLTIEGSYSGILTKHVPRIKVEGGHVFIPPFGSNVTFATQHSQLVVEEIVANGTVVEFASKDPKRESLRFDVHDAVLRDVQWSSPLNYQLKLQNPEPPGEIVTHGKFGAWTKGNPGETPFSGEYTFEQADLGVYGGIAGTLSSTGKYSGDLQHIDIAGTTNVPDFAVKSGGHKVQLVTKFDAFVDAIHGDTFLKRVDAHFGRTNLVVEGSVAGIQGRKGKTALLNLASPQGRIEDILGLFVKAPHSPMSGAVALRAKVEIPSGKQPFLNRVKMEGTFGVDDGSFSSPQTQKNVNELSAGARGEKMEDAETVLTDLKGQVGLDSGIAKFSDLSFGIPGAKARANGTYNLLNEKVDLHGRIRVDTKISKTETGMKSFLLKALDPLFKKKKKGEVVPVHITGTYDHPQFGLDVTKQKEHARQ